MLEPHVPMKFLIIAVYEDVESETQCTALGILLLKVGQVCTIRIFNENWCKTLVRLSH